ncbi:MAG: phosphoribosylglycinamide formyltransferase [Methanomassiliicoccales archaeon]|nr:phosphoribosylglycinamide formyltransferase [Methanomassiliicoccales archaeon]
MSCRATGEEDWSTLKIGWFTSGRDAQARALLEAVKKKAEGGAIDARIEFVFCNWEEGEEPQHADFAERERFFALVHQLGLPLITLSWKKFRSEIVAGKKDERRAEYGRKMRNMIYGHSFDLGLLAGYSLQMDADTCTRFDLVSLHPGPPYAPPGTEMEMIHRAIMARAESHGATIRTCAPEWEAQSIATFCAFSLRGSGYTPLWNALDAKLGDGTVDLVPKAEVESDPLFDRIRSDLERRERALVVLTLGLFSGSKLDLQKGKVYVDGRPLSGPYDLTQPVEDAIGKGEF